MNKNLGEIFPSCIFDLDARIGASYSGTGNTWKNLCAAPADGSSQAAYDFSKHATSIVFSGTPDDPSGKFVAATTTAQKFTIASGNTTFLTQLMREGAGNTRPFTMVLQWKNPSSTYRPSLSFFGGSGGADTTAGFYRFRASDTLGTGFNSTTSGGARRQAGTLPVLVPSGEYLMMVSMDAAGNCLSWLNGQMVSSTIDLTGMIDTTLSLSIFRDAAVGSELIAASMFNTAMSASDMNRLFSAYKRRATGEGVSLSFKEAAYSQETDDVFIALVTFYSDELEAPIRICSDPYQRLTSLGEDIYGLISNGDTYIFMPFDIWLPRDDKSGTVSAKMTIENIDRKIVEQARAVRKPVTVKIQCVMSSNLDFVEIEYDNFKLSDLSYDSTQIEGNLTLDYWGLEPFPSGRFIPSDFPGLF